MIAELADGRRLEFPDGTDPAVIQRTVKQLIGPTVPSTGSVALNAAAKGAAALPDMFLNAPVHTWNLGKMGLGMVAEKFGKPEILRETELTPTPDLARRGFEALGAIRPEADPQTGGQRILDTAIQGGVGLVASPARSVGQVIGNVVTGALSGAAGQAATEATGSPTAGIAAGLATPLALRAGRGLVSKPSPVNTPVRAETLAAAQKEGYVVPPSTVNPSFINERLESLAGKASVGQEAAQRNQAVTNALMARELGLPPGTPITEGVLEGIRKQAGKAYEDVQAMSPGGELRGLKVTTKPIQPMVPGPTTGLKVTEASGHPPTTGLKVKEIRDERGALTGMRVGQTSRGETGPLEGLRVAETTRGQDVPGALERLSMRVKETRGGQPLQDLRQLRADANAHYRHYERSADPKSLQRAKTAWAKAEEIENEFERVAQASGQPELVNQLRVARTMIAKTYDIERALNVGDSNVAAAIIGRTLDKGKPLTGNLKTVGRFAEAFPAAVREGGRVPSPGVSGTDAAAAAILGTLGYGAAGGPAGLMAGALPLVRGPARSMVLSPYYQRLMATPGQPASMRDALIKSILAGRAVSEAGGGMP
jgi:hypothetical protein